MGKKKDAKLRLKAKEDELDKFLATLSGAAEEADVDMVHNLINRGLKLKLGSQVMRARNCIKNGDLEGASMEIDTNDLAQGIRWCTHNKTTSKADESKELAEVVSELDAIRHRNRTRNLEAIGE